jgi:peptide deformylase
MILKIVNYPDPILRAKGKPVGEITDEVRHLVRDLLETMRDAQGVGLAAQQVGRALQLAVIDVTGIKERESRLWMEGKPVDPEAHMPLILINPIVEGTKTKVVGGEGCLSFPGLHTAIARSARVRVRTRTLEGGTLAFEAGGLLGRAVQHETDHLHGRLFIDLFTPAQKKELKPALERIKQGLPAFAEEPEEA